MTLGMNYFAPLALTVNHYFWFTGPQRFQKGKPLLRCTYHYIMCNMLLILQASYLLIVFNTISKMFEFILIREKYLL